MEVMVEVSSVPVYVSVTAQDKQSGEENGGGVALGRFSGRPVGSEKSEALSESSSSLGNPSEEEEEEEEEDDDEVSSGGGGGNEVVSANAGLGSLGSLEDSLPVKRGLSNCFAGRSKSFANLSEVKTVEDLGKEEKPFNKRRRTLIACKLLSSSRKSSVFYSWQNPNSKRLLALNENPNQEDNNNNDNSSEEEGGNNNLHQSKLNTFKSTSCFSLKDL